MENMTQPRAGARHAAIAALLLASWQAPASAALDVKLQANSNPAAPGEPLLVTLVVSNTDAFSRNGVVLRLPYPAGLNGLAHAATDGGFCDGTVSSNSSCDPSERLTWNVGTLAAGQSVIRTMPPVIAAGTPPGTTITFAADVADASGATAAASESVSVVVGRVLQLAYNEITPEPVLPGSPVTFQLSYGHTASSAVAANAMLSLPVPPGMSFQSASDGGVLTAGAVVWALGTLSPGETGERRATFAVSGGQAQGSALKSEAVLVADGGLVVRADGITQVGTPAGLSAALETNVGPAVPGETVRTTLTVTNPSFFDRSDVTARMRYPAGLANLSHGLVESGSCDGTVSSNSACDPQETLVWSLGTIGAGKSVTVTLPPAVAMSTLPGTVIPLTVRLADSSGGTLGIHDAVEVTNSRVLQLALTAVTPQPLLPGAALGYQLGWGHTASSAVSTAAVVELAVPPGLDFVTAGSGGSFADGKVRWTLGTLNPGQVGELRADFLVVGNVPEGSVLKPEATLGADGEKIVRADGVALVEASPGLLAWLDVNASPAVPGEVLGAKLTVSNTSAFDRSGVVARMRYPVGLGTVSHGLVEMGACDGTVSSNSSCDVNEDLIWTLGTLAAGRSVTVQLPPPVGTATLPGTMVPFEVQVSDSSGSTAHAAELVQVTNSRTLQLGLTETAQEPALPGTQLGYELAFGNTAASAVSTGSTLELVVPAGMGFVSASDGGTFSGGKVTWTLGTLNPAQVGRRELLLRTNPLNIPQAGTATKLEAVLQDSAGRRVRADDTTRVETEAALTLALTLTPNSGQPGEPTTVTLAATNTSAFNRANVALRLLYPMGLASLAHGSTGGGSCNGTISSNSACDPRETLTWNLGTVAAGATVTRTFTPSLDPSVLPGSVIEFVSWVEDATARSSATRLLRVGNAPACDALGGDSDGDGVCNAGTGADNCTLVANADQRDSDNDGYGNRCDADFDNNGIVNNADLARFKADFGKTGANLVTDLNGDGVVNNADLAIFKSLFGQPPGPSGRR